MIGQFDNVKIEGIAVAVPGYIENNSNYASVLGARRAKRQIRLTGVEKRHVAGKHQRTSDLCYRAAKDLLDKLQWKKEEIKVLIMVTQSGNYSVPSTSFFLQQRLGIPKDCVVFDINLGCSSFNAGVHVVSALLQNCELFDKALLLIGDTSGVIPGPGQKLDADIIADRILFGSAGAAIAMQKVEKNPLLFMNQSDGTGYEAIIGYRGRPCVMDGAKVFEFAINDVVDSLKVFRNHFLIKEEDVDYYVFHQAQELILDSIAASCEISEEKELRSLSEYGNTSGTSVPVSVCANKDKFEDKEKIRVLFTGFGVGLSWGSIYTEVDTSNILPIIVTDEYYEDDKNEARLLADKKILVIGSDMPMGEYMTRHLDNSTASVVMHGNAEEKLKEIQKDLFMDSYIVPNMGEGSDISGDISNFCQNNEIKLNGAVFSDEMITIREMQDLVRNNQWDDWFAEGASLVVLIHDLSQEEEWQSLIEEWQEAADELDIRVNAVIYDTNKMDIKQVAGNGLDWFNCFLEKGCPKEMKRPVYVANTVCHLLADVSLCTAGNVIKVRN